LSRVEAAALAAEVVETGAALREYHHPVNTGELLERGRDFGGDARSSQIACQGQLPAKL
jgi:hypothetical protein